MSGRDTGIDKIEFAIQRRFGYLICRNCGARNPPEAEKCRRCKSRNLRPKKFRRR